MKNPIHSHQDIEVCHDDISALIALCVCEFKSVCGCVLELPLYYVKSGLFNSCLGIFKGPV